MNRPNYKRGQPLVEQLRAMGHITTRCTFLLTGLGFSTSTIAALTQQSISNVIRTRQRVSEDGHVLATIAELLAAEPPVLDVDELQRYIAVPEVAERIDEYRSTLAAIGRLKRDARSSLKDLLVANGERYSHGDGMPADAPNTIKHHTDLLAIVLMASIRAGVISPAEIRDNFGTQHTTQKYDLGEGVVVRISVPRGQDVIVEYTTNKIIVRRRT